MIFLNIINFKNGCLNIYIYIYIYIIFHYLKILEYFKGKKKLFEIYVYGNTCQ